ncbi:glutaredoxin 3 [Thermochromatium tepidum]|uniref:Glutaredoxin n=1 Tax=Thermochromatium tepidum ATCC 43061 TaxID=316276 RepID=A0A6I6EDI0_THETI|nr:glutaredoxin 3 [Thermochromatium tepidum]QGU33019.1 glutaredoxin 3 [Thermochromatium tepidum ATCC 43061]
MPQVTVYTTQTCPYCDRARRLLKRKGVHFTEIPVDQDRARMTEMVERSGRHTVPQIFIDDFHVGGYDDMVLLDMEGELDERLGLDTDD